MGEKIISIYKYHIYTADENQREEGEREKRFAAFNTRVENEMLGVKWLNPIQCQDAILIQDIIWIDFLGEEKVVLDTEIDRACEAS